MIFDTHIHLNDNEFVADLDRYIKEANEKGVSNFLCVGFDLESSKLAIEIAKKYKGVYAAIGVIPTEHKQYITLSSRQNKPTIEEIRDLAKINARYVKAIGEIGLDYYWENEPDIKDKQKEMFLEQIRLANELNLPVSIHARDSLQDTLDILKTHAVNQKGIMHCYSGSKEMAVEFTKLGFKIAFGGVLTFKNSKEVKEVIKVLDLEDIVFETDAPYLAPSPFRGKLNEPKYIFETVKFASEYLGIKQEKLEEITYCNSCKILHVKNEN